MIDDLRANTTWQALTCMLLSTVILSAMHGLVRHLSADLHPFVIAFYRNLFGFVAILPLLLRSGFGALRTDNPGLHVVRALVGVVAMLAWFYSLSRVPIANATALSFSTTLFATLTAWLFLGERLRVRRWLAIVVGFFGVVVVIRPDPGAFDAEALWVLLAAIAWGASITVVKQLTRTESSTTIVAWMGISLTLLSFFPAVTVWSWPDTRALFELGLIGVLATSGHLLMTQAIRGADVAVVTSVDFTRLIWTSIIGALFFAEILDRWTLFGATIIFAAGWYIVFRESRQR